MCETPVVANWVGSLEEVRERKVLWEVEREWEIVVEIKCEVP